MVETYLIGCYISAVLLFIVYIVTTCMTFDCIPKSISDTYYLWSDGMQFKTMFTMFMWTDAMLLIIPWITMSPDNLRSLVFLSCGAMMFVGAAAKFKEDLTDSVHYTSAGIWAGSALLWTVLMAITVDIVYIRAIVAGLVLGAAGYAITKKSFTFWAECACAVMMIASVAILMFY